MTTFSSGVSLTVLNQLLFIIMLNLVPLLIWAMWDLEQRRRSWLARRQTSESIRRHRSQTRQPSQT